MMLSNKTTVPYHKKMSVLLELFYILPLMNNTGFCRRLPLLKSISDNLHLVQIKEYILCYSDIANINFCTIYSFSETDNNFRG